MATQGSSTTRSPQPPPIGWDQSPTVIRGLPASPHGPGPGAGGELAGSPPVAGDRFDGTADAQASAASLPVSGDNLYNDPHYGDAPQLIGKQLGDYVLEAPVGGGGMGLVFRARDVRLQRTVAVKVLTSRWDRDGELKRRFQNEAQSAARLNHENIATIFDVGESQGWSYIVFEFLDGINVRDLVLRDGPLPIDSAVHITRQMAHALAHAATRDVVHRDIKPSNILLTPDNRAKLVDMGLARLHDARPADGDLTASGVTLGTFDYISPEQAHDPRQADLRSDIYSLGCTLYFMLCGQPPFPEGTVLQKLVSHTSEEPADPRLIRDDLPIGLVQVLRRMMCKDPAERYQHPEVLIADLAALQHGRPLYPELSRRAASPWGTVWPWLVPSLILGIGLIVGEVMLSAMAGGEMGRIPSFHVPLPRPPAASGPTSGASERTANGAADGSRASAMATLPPPAQSAPPDPAQAPPLPEGVNATGAASSAEPPDPTARPSGVVAADEPVGPTDLPTHSPSLQTVDEPEFSRVIVANALYTAEDAHVTRSLADAIRYCHRHAAVRRIDLEFDGPLPMDEPVRISQRELTIAAAPGYSPTCLFTSSEATEETHLIEVQFGKIIWQDINLVWQVPRTLEVPQRFLLLYPQVACEFRHCTMTVDNDFQQAPYHEGLMAITIASPGALTDRRVTATELVFRDFLVRGECGLIAVQPGGNVAVQGDHVAMLLTDTFFDYSTGGDTRPERASSQFRLAHAVLACRQGLGAVDTGFDRSHIPTVEVALSHSVVLLPSGGALFRQTGSGQLAEYVSSFHYQGEQNLFCGEGTLWEIDARGQDYHDSFSWARWQSHWTNQVPGADRGSHRLAKPVSWERTRPWHVVSLSEIRSLIPPDSERPEPLRLPLGPNFSQLMLPN